MKKEYSLQELASILGCSRTAIAKKIKSIGHNTDIKRYKNRYDVVMIDGKMHILLDDEELEEEKRVSKGFNNVSEEGFNTVENENIIDIEPIETEKPKTEIIEFTERYIEKFATLQESLYNELRQRDNQLLLLTKSENSKQYEIFQVQAENKTLQLRNNVLKTFLIIVVTLLILVSVGFITFVIKSYNPSQPVTNVSETVINDKKPAEVQEVVTPPTPQQTSNVSNQRKR